MRKLCYFLLGAAGLLMASCSQEDLESPAVKGDGNYNVRVTLPGDMLTRSLGDGLSANKLLVAVYDADNNNAPVFQDITSYSFQAGQLTTTVSMNLVNGKTYNIAFFALSFEAFNQPEPVYNFDMGNGTITVNYENMTSDANIADSYDCFFKLHNTGKISEDSMDVNVTLTRPMAQINWGTDDLAQPAILNNYGENGQYIETTLTTEAYNVFDMFTGTTTGDKVDVTLANWASPISQTFPVNPYRYVAMSYLLAPATSDVYDLSLNITNDLNTNVAVHSSNTIEVSSAPVQANFRTNIYGTLLSDVVTFNVDKDPTWGTPDYDHQIWDGKTLTEPDELSDGTFVIKNASEWAWFVENKSRTWNGKVKLAGDLDFGGNEIQGIYYTGNFDGQGFTISNLTITPRSSYATGFFAGDSGSNTPGPLTVNNVNFVNVTASNNNTSNGWVGVVIGDVQDFNVELNNVNVSNANLTGVQSMGGLVGFVSSGRTLTINNCSVTASTISNIPVINESGNIGGLVGRPVGTVTITGSTVSNTTINGYWVAKRGESSIQAAVGTMPTVEGVTVTNVNVNRTEVTSGVSVNGTSYETLQDAMTSAPDGSTITLGLGSFATPTDMGTGKTFTFVGLGEEYTTIQANDPYWTATNCNFTFKNLTLKSFVNNTNHTSMAFNGAASATFENVTFNGEYHATSGNQSFTNCTFLYDKVTGTNYNLWCQSSGTTNITDCTFTCGPARAILVYGATAGSVGGNINIDNMTVTAQTADSKGVIEIHTENYTSAGTITIKNVTYPSSMFGGGLYVQINNTTKQPSSLYKIEVL